MSDAESPANAHPRFTAALREPNPDVGVRRLPAATRAATRTGARTAAATAVGSKAGQTGQTGETGGAVETGETGQIVRSLIAHVGGTPLDLRERTA
ncbi:hypothetical protein QCN29_10065 [Streptomyces sp. HNM0663]|uniref:Uncharacterized protein n=1 Tax=Streptomyces chengmaiensis TaxID=3040919 RepID=A0ABT6HK55_9ACTN|nr:hypothetical protein [Streptomyces chengmaiensis]MDH2389128.1 hypothetical protein [Streptomyces chengmaiensis]